jgi:serine/threonine-protein kinase
VQTAATDTLVGRSLEGRYRILEPIARGGMSTVYAAVDERLDRLVAVKVMSSALSADPAFTDRFAREARAAARLTHLNVVSVYDQGQEADPDGHRVFLVMELIEGRTLRELLRERGRLAPAEAISIMEPVLSALAAAHRAGLVHRDVKPENILLSDDGVVKVADFGLARAVESDAAATRTGLMMGTVAYCAPEQISEGRADPRSDVYAAGVVLFELLTGTPPYKGESAMNVAYQHVHSRVPAPSSRVRGIPNELDEIVIAATDSDPTGRPSDAGAFLAEIADLRSALGLPVVPVPPRDRPRGRAARNDPRYRTPDAATTATIRAGAHSDTTVVPQRGGARTTALARDDAPPPPVVIPPPKKQVSRRSRRRRRALLALLVVLLLAIPATIGGIKLAHYLDGRFFKHVPNVVHDSQADAIKALEHAGYHLGGLYNAFSDTVGKGLVISTDPKAGAHLAAGKTVSITVSSGPKMISIPSVTHDTFDQALSRLQNLGLNVAGKPRQQPSDTVPQNQVIDTDPKAGSAVTDRQLVTILVSTGPPVIDVPSIAQGTPFDQAKQKLTQAGFKVTEVEEWNDTVTKGEVITVNPSDQAQKGSQITVTVSKGPQFVTIPNFTEFESANDVKHALESLGLNVVVRNPLGGDGNVVLRVNPPSGTTVQVGSTVTITVF